MMGLNAWQNHIVELGTCKGGRIAPILYGIFINFEEGNLQELSNDSGFALTSMQEECLGQMVSALESLDHQGILCRDAKPENILYSKSLDGQQRKHFRTADFGVGKLGRQTRSYHGTLDLMAPEIIALSDLSINLASVQTWHIPKVDVWSLFVSLAWAIDAGGFQSTLR